MRVLLASLVAATSMVAIVHRCAGNADGAHIEDTKNETGWGGCPVGWMGENCAQPVCMPSCRNGGTCMCPGVCVCTSMWTGSTCETGMQYYTYVGCYEEGYGDNDLSDDDIISSSMTVEYCYNYCKLHYKYFAIRYSRCTCGNSYGRHGKAKERLCSSSCPGNSTQVCGGSSRNSIYEVTG